MIKSSTMAKRSYRQNCSLARAADVVGERWTLLLIRDLLLGSRRYSELSRSMKGMGSNLLATRLKEMEAAGLAEKQGDGRYALTERGRALEPTVLALVRWGMVYGPEAQEGFHHLDAWDLVALKALFHPEYAVDLSVTVQFKTDDFAAWMRVEDRHVDMGLGEAAEADVIVAGTIKDLFTGPRTAAELCGSGSVEQLKRFKSAFILRI